MEDSLSDYGLLTTRMGDCADLLGAIRGNTKVRDVRLVPELDDATVLAYLDALAHCPNLIEVAYEPLHCSPAVSRALTRLQGVRKLTVGQHSNSETPIETVRLLCEAIRGMHTDLMVKLSFVSNVEAWVSHLAGVTNVKELQLFVCHLAQPFNVTPLHLDTLWWVECRCPADALDAIMESIVQAPDFRWADRYPDEVLTSFCAALRRSPPLQRLDVSCLRLEDASWPLLWHAIGDNTTLQTLKVAGPGDAGASWNDSMHAMLVHNNRHLRELDLTLHEDEDALRFLTSLSSVDTSQCKLASVRLSLSWCTDNVIKALSQHPSPLLHVLDLAGCRRGSLTADTLLSTIALLPQLRELCLNWTFEDAGIERALCDWLPGPECPKTLTRLQIVWKDVSTEAMQPLARAVAMNPQVTHVTVRVSNEVEEDAWLSVLLRDRLDLHVEAHKRQSDYKPTRMHRVLQQNRVLLPLLRWPGCGWRFVSARNDVNDVHVRQVAWNTYTPLVKAVAMTWMLIGRRAHLPWELIHLVMQYIVEDFAHLRRMMFNDDVYV